jgi:Dolichyl-phosphate-mannose-protein mannosyltransferase
MVRPDARPDAGRRARPFLIPLSPSLIIVCGMAGAALVALVVYDLSFPLALNDDWMYSWSVRQLVAGHGLRVFPESTALAIPQVFWGAIFSLGHPDPRLLRLSVVPIVGSTAWISYLLARRLGADRFWAAVAGTALLAMPLFMTNATTFMTDNVFVGIVMAVALTSLAWVNHGKWRWLCVALLVLAPLERQVGLALIPAVTLGLAMWRRPAWARSDTAALVAIWVIPFGALLAASRLLIRQPLYSPADLFQLQVDHAIFPLAAILGLGLIPFSAALAFRPRLPGRESGWSLACAGLGLLGAIGCLVDLARFGMIFPGNVFSPLGFAAILPGSKPPVFPGLVFQVVEIAAVITLVMLFIVRRRWWTPSRLAPDSVLLIVISASQFLPLLAVQIFVYDRYFLPVLAPLVPLIASMATAGVRQRVARSWAALALAGGLAMYVIGEQDYLAWQAARDQAARLAYQSVPRDRVQAGFEANAVYVELPRYERSGRADLFAILGPAQPEVTLRIEPPSDPRPGVAYGSLAPGRVVLDR